MGKERFLEELGSLTEVTKVSSGKSDPVRDISVDKGVNPSAEKTIVSITQFYFCCGYFR